MTQRREKVLRNRSKRASKGRNIRVSDAVFKFLNKSRGKRSWDVHLRILFGLPDRAGTLQNLVIGFIDVATGKFFFDEKDAYEVAILEAARNKHRVHRPLRVREIPREY